ncbi:hypothetical protein I5I61_09685 [Pseudomonas nitroreducens]|uniref:Uncharacterized protein n=1 Tax=Pseudomonas nitroreducens TaxID=46680 RepID=A0ABS0KIH1_PSENT|nr:hypothetical protein [Pseudomonas nitroreducens]MBG6287714.1 hypothetical protein [Pseudomonas nitroreducens]
MSELMDQAVICMPYEMAMEGEVARRQFYSRAQSLLAEVQLLRDQVGALQSAEGSYQSGYDDGRRMGAKHRQSEVEQLRRDLEALRARVVVVPDSPFDPVGEWAERNNGWNYCKDAIARLNGNAVSEGLLRRLSRADTDGIMWSDCEELRKLLGDEKESGS